ncbi:MAG: DNA-directed RNA polymerase subunit delta [Ulvibacter sp.]|jgi:DNA-directed RNA polymerase subunit delta
MIRKIVDFQKLNQDILNLLVEKFPDGYDDKHIISFRNAKNEIIEAVEVRTADTIYLVKVGVKLVKAMEDFEDDDTASHDNVDTDSSNEKNLDLIED